MRVLLEIFFQGRGADVVLSYCLVFYGIGTILYTDTSTSNSELI